MRTDRHARFVRERARRSAIYRKTFARTLQQIDLALLVREMREGAQLTQADLAKRIGTTQSVIARLEDAEYRGHSLSMMERIATACGVSLGYTPRKGPTSSVKSRWLDSAESAENQNPQRCKPKERRCNSVGHAPAH